MWCHLCTQDYPDFEDFRIHIMEKHRNASNFCKENSDNESVHENAVTLEINEENTASDRNCYESDHSIGVEMKSDTSMDGNDNTVALNVSPGKYKNISSETKSDDSMDADDNAVHGKYNNLDLMIAAKNKSSLSKAAFHNLPRKYKNVDIDVKSDDNMDADSNTMPGKYNNSDHIITTKNKSNLSKTTLSNLPGKSHDEEAGTSVIKNILLKKRRQHCNKENKSSLKVAALNKSAKILKKTSILKKRGRKKQMQVSFNKKALPKRKISAFSHKEDIPEDSDGHSESSLNDDNEVNPQSVPNNCINPASTIPVKNYPQSIPNNCNNPASTVPVKNYPQSIPNNCINPIPTIPVKNYPQPISNNRIFIVNPYGNQSMNNYIVGNQAGQPPVYILNTVAAKPTTSKSLKCFDFHSENILKWLMKHKELCKNIEYPLSSSLFSQVKAVHKGIFDHYCIASNKEETTAVLKVYEELDCMIHKHINAIHNPSGVF